MAGPSGCAGLQVGNKAEQERWFKKGGMKGDLVLYDSLVWLMGSPEGLPACQEPQTLRQREGCLCSSAWEPTAFAAPALDYLTLPFRPANQCPSVGKLLPLRSHP